MVTSDNGYCPGAYGQLMELPDSCMSRMSVSMGVLPTRRMKKSWEMRLAGTALRAGSRSRSRPKRWGCPGYCMRSYSVRATWAFSCKLSTWAESVSPHASKHKEHQIFRYETRLPLTQLVKHDASKDKVMVELNNKDGPLAWVKLPTSHSFPMESSMRGKWSYVEFSDLIWVLDALKESNLIKTRIVRWELQSLD